MLDYHVNLMVLLKPLILPCNILNDDIMLYLFILEALVIHLIPLWSSFMHYFFGASRHCPLGLEIPLKIILTYLFCGLIFSRQPNHKVDQFSRFPNFPLNPR